MSREAMKLALEALSAWEDVAPQYWDERDEKVIIALREALAKPDFWEGYVPEPDKRQQALDKKAENARELGLDYEPAQQEPVAYIHRQGNHYEVSERFLSDDEKSRGWTEEPLYTSPPAQRTWVGLTDEDKQIAFDDTQEGGGFWEFADAIEAKLKEKNT